jgi:signal transduction histidine kinase
MYEFKQASKMMLLLFILYFFPFSSLVYAQKAPIDFHHFSVNEGLSQNSIWCMYRDSRNWLWAASSGGLTCKIGSKVLVYKQAKSDSNTLQGNNVNFIFEDKYGKIWIGSDGGIDVYDAATQIFHKAYSFHHASPSGQRVYFYLTEPNKEYVWIGINNEQVYRFNLKDQKPEQEISYLFPRPQAFKYLIWSSVQTDKKAFMYFDNMQLLEYDFELKKMRVLPLQVKYGTGLYLMNDTCYYYTKGEIKAWDGKREIFIKNAPGLTVCRSITKWQNYLVFAGEDGYILYNLADKTQRYYSSFDRQKEKTYCRIVSTHVDKQGILWLGTDGKGIYYHTPLQNRFKHISYEDEDNNMVKGMCMAEPNYLLHVVFGKGIIRNEVSSGEWKLLEGEKSFPRLKSKTFSATCNSLKPQHIWVAHTLTGGVCGLYQLNYITGVGQDFSHLVTPVLGDMNVTAYTAYIDNYNQKTYLISNSSLIEIDERLGQPKSKIIYYDTSVALSCFKFGRDGKVVVIGHSRGALVANYKENKLVLRLKELGKDLVKCIVQDKQGNYYVGSTNGVFIYNEQFKFIEHLSTKNGLADNFVYGLLLDDDGALWMSHNKGINRFEIATHTWQHFDAKDGLQSNEFNTNAFAKAINGTLYFGGVNGINSFDPKQFLKKFEGPLAFVNTVNVFDEPLKTDSSWIYRKALHLPYTSNTLSFEFGHNDLMEPDEVNYVYKLEGIDVDWIQDRGKGFARYPKLASGQYYLQLKALNKEGNWNGKTYVLEVNIAAPYWQTWWFRLLLVLLGVLLVSLIIWVMVRRNKLKMQREFLLQKSLEDDRLRISRDLHDHVGAQLSYLISNIEWMLSHPMELSKEEEYIRLRDLSETGKQAILTLRQTIWALHNTEISVIDFADKFKQFAKKMIAFSVQTKLHFEETIVGDVVLKPEIALNLFRIGQEALGNSLKHAHASEISIKFISNEECKFCFEICDNGKGFHGNENRSEAHYGLDNMRARAAECTAQIEIESEIGKGTTVKVYL